MDEAKLSQIQTWYQTKTDITRCNLLHFQFHNLAAVLMYTLHPSLVEYVSYGVEKENCFNIIRETPEGSNVEVIHYIATEPEETRNFLEDMLIGMIEQPQNESPKI